MTIDEHIESAFLRDYREGSWDCALFVSKWVDAVSLTSISRTLFASYSNTLEGLRKYREETGPTTIAAIASRFLIEAGWEQFTTNPREGDVAVFKDGEIGLVWKTYGVKLVPGRAIKMIATTEIRSVWRWKGGRD